MQRGGFEVGLARLTSTLACIFFSLIILRISVSHIITSLDGSLNLLWDCATYATGAPSTTYFSVEKVDTNDLFIGCSYF